MGVSFFRRLWTIETNTHQNVDLTFSTTAQKPQLFRTLRVRFVAGGALQRLLWGGVWWGLTNPAKS